MPCRASCCPLPSAQLRPLLGELSALRRGEQALQKQVDQLQLQLAHAEREAAAATAAAATDRAHARRTIGQAQARLGAALQRLKALAERQQQQTLHLQEVRTVSLHVFWCAHFLHTLGVHSLSLHLQEERCGTFGRGACSEVGMK